MKWFRDISIVTGGKTPKTKQTNKQKLVLWFKTEMTLIASYLKAWS